MSTAVSTEPTNHAPVSQVQADAAIAPHDNVAARAVELGIAGLPPADFDLLPGGMYALKARTSSARFPLFASLISCALAQQRRCFLITASKPQDVLARLDPLLSEPTQALIEAGALHVFGTQDDMPKRIFRFGADRFTQELGHFGVAADALLIYDQADELLSLHDLFLAVQQVDVLRNWCQNQQVTALLSFSKPGDRQDDSFNALMDYFSGIARLGGDKSGLELTFLYWRATNGTNAAINYRLSLDDRNMYQAVAVQTPAVIDADAADASGRVDRRGGGPSNAADSREQQLVFYNDPALDSMAMQQAGSWLRAETPDEIRTALTGLHSGTLALNAGSTQSLQTAARLVHSLRTEISSRIQIIAYVTDRQLTVNESQLLLRSGANFAIPVFTVDELNASIVRVRAQIFIRSIEPQFDTIWTRYLQECARTDAAPPSTFAAAAAANADIDIDTNANADINRKSTPITATAAGTRAGNRNGFSFGSDNTVAISAPRAANKAKRTSLLS